MYRRSGAGRPRPSLCPVSRSRSPRRCGVFQRAAYRAGLSRFQPGGQNSGLAVQKYLVKLLILPFPGAARLVGGLVLPLCRGQLPLLRPVFRQFPGVGGDALPVLPQPFRRAPGRHQLLAHRLQPVHLLL